MPCRCRLASALNKETMFQVFISQGLNNGAQRQALAEAADSASDAGRCSSRVESHPPPSLLLCLLLARHPFL